MRPAPAPALALCTLCAAVLPLWARAGGLEDVQALIQHERALGQVALDREHALEQLGSQGDEGVTVTRISASAESGSSWQLSLPPFCPNEDAFGLTQCVVQFDALLNNSVHVHVENGIQPGDVFAVEFRADNSFNESSPFAGFIKPTVHFTNACQFCQGTCSMQYKDQDVSLNIVSPSTADDADICNDSHIEDFSVNSSKTETWLKPPADLALQGNLTVAWALKTQALQTRAAASYNFTFGQPAASLAARSAAPPAAALGLPAFLAKVVRSRVEGALGSLKPLERLAKLGPPRTREAWAMNATRHGMILNLTLEDFKTPMSKNISMTFSQGCTSDGQGSMACVLPFGENISSSLFAEIMIDAEEGATVATNVDIQLGGTLGQLVGLAMPKINYTVPLCGEAPTFVEIAGVNETVEPGKCGHYSMELKTLVPKIFNIPDFDDAEIPLPEAPAFLPTSLSLNGILPISGSVEVDLKHKDGSRMAHIATAMGITTLGHDVARGAAPDYQRLRGRTSILGILGLTWMRH